jgi:hypothetical protein
MSVIICKFEKKTSSFFFFGIVGEILIRYISTKSMILIMFIQTYKTIRSVFSKASDLSITVERLNSSTYVYATVKTYPGKLPSIWMFNFLSFAGKSIICFSLRNSSNFFS